jgi:GH25 family lysozyme M1 (1,4-beta-N-acetylmuramidase)
MKRLIDISYYQDPSKIDYDALAGSVDGVILRAAYGVRYNPDTAFNKHYQEFTARGVPVGAYHFLVEYETVDAQLALLKQTLDGKDLPLGIWNDVELENGAPALTRKQVIEFMTKGEAAFGEMGIYTGAWCWNPIMGSDNPYSSRRLWVGSYTASPYIPIGWDSWWLWQYTSSGRLPGYGSSLDMNKCTDETWAAWVGFTPPPPIIEPLPIEPLSQKDTRWANEKLGTSPVTIGAYGCLITATAMVCNYYGKDTNPSKLNQDLIVVNGYESGNLMKWGAIETIYPDIILDWDRFLANPTDVDIDAVLKRDQPVIVQVDYNLATPALDQHWVVIVGKDGDDYLIADPIDGSTAYLSRYAGKAWRMAVYKQVAIEEPLFKVKVIAGALNVRSEPVYKPDGSNKIDLLYNGEVVNVYQIADNGWYRIGVDRWISGYADYTEKIEIEPPPPPPPPPMTLEERVADNTRRIEILEEYNNGR